MGLVGLAKRWIVGRGRPSFDQVGSWIPKRGSTVQEIESEGALVLRVRIESPKKSTEEKHKDFELDAVGAFVWSQIDGSRTIRKISENLRREFKLHRVESEAALSVFMETLSRKGLVELKSSQEPIAGAPKKGAKR